MSTNDKNRIDALLVEVLRKPVDEREAFLDLVCRDDDNLRRELNGLLAASDEAADFLERPAVQVSETILTPLRESPGTIIGRYKLLQHIGEGGFGVVYMAEQTEPIKRKVALKIIKLGMDTKQVIARFEAERQALALMEHPNIARVFDAGATETGRPYFVMELVRGVPITEYCDTENLSTQERLKLFLQVCHAVQHAHQKGIIHRDIKPTNVMITLHDGEPVPKIIDFGIAKATNRELTDKTLFTEFRQFVGTPAYMSPEQAEMSGLDIDTRSDIYSLGVLLYELLTGTTPFDAAHLRSAAFGEIQRIIREVEPPKPSTRLSTLASEPRPLGSGPSFLAEIAKHRRTDPSALSKLIRGDLDWIVMKALEKNRTRRYDNANEFAKDVEHHLAHEPILAGRPGMANKLRKFVKRNRVAVTAGSLVAAAIVVGLIVSTIGFVQASRQRDRALIAEQEQSSERQRAEAARNEAEQARTAETKQRKLAVSERDHAIEAKQEARQQAYIANIAAASAALSANEIGTVRRRLEASPPEFRNWEWEYLSAETDVSLAVLHGHERAVLLSVAFSPDGTRLASAAWDKTIRIWDAETGTQMTVLRGHDERVLSVAFSPDGSRLASASDDKTVRLWNAITGEELAVLKKHGDEVISVAFSPDGMRLVSASDDMTVRVWDVSTGQQLIVLRGHEDEVWSVVFSPDGSRLASGSKDKTVRLWDASTGEELAVLRGHEAWVGKLAFSPDGTRLVSPSRDGTVRIWDTATGRQLAILHGHNGYVCAVAFSPDGTRLASASSDSTVRLWDPATAETRGILRGHKGLIQDVAFSPDGTRLASASGWGGTSADNTVCLWDPVTGEELAVLREHEDAVLALAFSPDGMLLASGSADDTVRLWNPVTSEEVVVLRGHEDTVLAVAFSPDGILLASASADRTARLWNASTGEELDVLRGHDDRVNSVTFSPDGTRLASGSADGTVCLWDVLGREQLTVLTGHSEPVWSVAFSPDGRHLASGSVDKTVRLWDVLDGEELVVLKGHEQAVYHVAFSPDGTRLASVSSDRTVRLWETATGEELVVLRGHEDDVSSVTFSPDGTRLVSASDDGTVRIWDSIPFRVRHQERQAILAARPEAKRIVDARWLKYHDWKTVAVRLHEDDSLTEPLRRAALNLVLRRAMDHP